MSVARYFGKMWDDSLNKMVPWENYECLENIFVNGSLGSGKSHTINIANNKLIGLPIATSCRRNKKVYHLGIILCIFLTFIYVTRLCRSNTTILFWIPYLLDLYREMNSGRSLSELVTRPFSPQTLFLAWLFLVILYYWIWTLSLFLKSRPLTLKWIFLEQLKFIMVC